MRENSKCPKCNSNNTRLMVQSLLSIPTGMEMNLTKSNLRSKEVEQWGTYWDSATFICRDCGYTRDRGKTPMWRQEREMKLILYRLCYINGWAGDRMKAVVKRAREFLTKNPLVNEKGKARKPSSGWDKR